MSISCAICLLLYKEPSSVPCGHVFCADCLSAYIARTKKNGRASCPSCRKEFHCDPQLIPPTINSHVLPSIRRIFIDAETDEVQKLKAKLDENEQEISELKRRESALRTEFETFKKTLVSKVVKLKTDTEELYKDLKVISELGKADALPGPSALAGPSRTPRDTNTRRRSNVVSPKSVPTWR